LKESLALALPASVLSVSSVVIFELVRAQGRQRGRAPREKARREVAAHKIKKQS
jgi:hypothetical protein